MICPYMQGEEIQVLQETTEPKEENGNFLQNIAVVMHRPMVCMEDRCAAWCKQRQRCEYHRIFRD